MTDEHPPDEAMQPQQTDPSSERGSTEPPTQPSRIGQWFRRSLRWLVGIAMVFLVGVLLMFFARVRPQADTIKGLQIDLTEAEREVDNLQSELDRLEPLEQENESLQAELDRRQHHLELLAVLVDVSRAQLSLAQDQPGVAKADLEATDDRLQALESGLTGEPADTVGSMRDRLRLVLEELDSDAFAAERDLEILSNNLVDLEGRLFH